MTPSAKIRETILESGKPLKHIAHEAAVDYQVLWRWWSGQTKTIDIDIANSISVVLTGREITV